MTELQKLKTLFYDKKQGFIDSNKLYNKAKENNIHLSFKDVLDFYNKQPVNQIMKRIVRPKKFSSFKADYPKQIYQMDIIVYNRFKYHNYQYIFVVIDIYSRYVSARAMTNRRAETIFENFEDICEEMGKPEQIQCDNEFNNKIFNRFYEENNIKTRFSDPDEPHKNPIIERVNGTIATLLQKIRITTKDYDWKNYLQDAIYNYNHTIHSTTKQTPISLWEQTTKSKQKIIFVPNKFNVNDKVRIVRQKTIFHKGDALKLSKDVYLVEKVEGNKIKLYDFQKFYKPEELHKITSVEELDEPIEEPHMETEKNKIEQMWKREDINPENILTFKRKRNNFKVID